MSFVFSKKLSSHSTKLKLDVAGVKLAGKSLQPPNLVQTGWTPGQRFTASDDPDRTRLAWVPPAFITYQDPVKRSAKTRVEELDLSGVDREGSFARVVHGVLTEKECAQFIDAINKKGFTPALINTGGGKQQYYPTYRKGWRMIADDKALTQWLFAVLQPHLPATYLNFSRTARLADLNERCRFLCYEPGQYFAPHYDGCYTRPSGPRRGHASVITVQVYLHDIPAAYGGATTFLEEGLAAPLPCQPRAGSVLVFTQDLRHEGSKLTRGIKYTFRTEAMYDPNPAPEESKKKQKEEKGKKTESEHAAATAGAAAATGGEDATINAMSKLLNL